MIYVRGYNDNSGEFEYFKVNPLNDITDPHIVDLVILHRVTGIPEYENFSDAPGVANEGDKAIILGRLHFWNESLNVWKDINTYINLSEKRQYINFDLGGEIIS